MRRPRVLLLDIDDTLYAYAPAHDAGLSAAAAGAATLLPRWSSPEAFRHDYAAARREAKRHTRGQAASHARSLYFKQLVETHLGGVPAAPFATLFDAYWSAYFAAMKLDPGCRELLAAARAHGARITCVSNFTTRRQIQKLAVLGVDDLVDHLVTSEQVGVEKPDPRTITVALAQHDVTPGDAWFVGDDPVDDVAMAARAGVFSVWLRRDGRDAHAEGADLVVPDWPTLHEIYRRAS